MNVISFLYKVKQLTILIVLLLCNSLLFSQEDNNSLNVQTIIKKVIQNKEINASKQRFKSFEYNNYNKVIFSAYDSLISNKINTVTDFRLKSFLKIKSDSASYKFKQQIKNKHFFLAEKLSKHQFANNREKETILAVKMAGFKEPISEFISLSTTKIDFYKDKLNLLGTNYVSPLAKNAINNYRYKINNISDNYYEIHFKSKRRKKSVGLEGLLYIDKKTYALTKVSTNIYGKIKVKITQDFTYLKSYKHWFVNNTKIVLTKGSSKFSIKAFRIMIGFRPKYSVTKFNPEEVSYIQIDSKIDSIAINKPIKIKRTDCAIYIDEKAINRDSNYWKSKKYNFDPKEKRTYQFLDSLIEKHKIENKLNFIRKIKTGKFATKIFDIELGQLFSFNNHEGFRLGFGGNTNESVSSKFRLNGHLAYGFKDEKTKYSYGIDFILNKPTNTWIGAKFTNDLFESAKPKLLFKEPNFALINPRNANISLFYRYKTADIHINHDIAPNLVTKTQISTGKYQNLFDYSFISRTKLMHNYNLTNLKFGIEWTPKSKYIATPKGKFSVKKEYPKINAEITKSFNNVLDGDFDYTQAFVKLNHEIKTIKSGSTEFLVKFAYTLGEAPYSHLFNHVSNHLLTNPWRTRINLSGINAFDTMLFNEFISDKYASIQIRQNFEKFRIGRNFKPKLSFVTRYAIGTIKNPINHRGVNIKTIKKGYFESGIVLNQLLYGIGLSSFYRYGPYQFDNFKDNITLKVTYVIDFL